MSHQPLQPSFHKALIRGTPSSGNQMTGRSCPDLCLALAHQPMALGDQFAAGRNLGSAAGRGE